MATKKTGSGGAGKKGGGGVGSKKGGGGGGRKSGGGGGGGSVLNAPLDAVGGALKQGRGIAGELAERASSLGRAALESASSSLESVSPTAAELLRPGAPRAGQSTARTSNKRKPSKVGSGESEAAKGARKATAAAGRTAQKAVGSASRSVAQSIAPVPAKSGGKAGGSGTSAGKSGGKSSKGGAKKK